MAGRNEARARPASTQEISRRHAGGVSTRRGGATSPSGISSSDSDDYGGAPLSSGISALNIDDSSGSGSAIYAPPHIRQTHNQPGSDSTIRDNAASRTPSGFQLGNAPNDADVFNEPSHPNDEAMAQNNMVRFAGRARAAGVRIEAPNESTTGNGNINTPFTNSPMRRNRNITSGALLASPETHNSGATQHRSTSYASPPSYSMALRNTPSESSTRHQVGGVDAQAFYPPNACVFVANLPEGVNDIRLEAEVTRLFSEFGTVYVKIRRDARNMPFAFCQYITEAEAQVAMTNGKGRMVYGRPCRTEPVRANRTYIMHRANGDDLDVDEARRALTERGFHFIERCEELPSDIQSQQGMSRSVLVKLKNFDPTKELQSAFRHHQHYRVIPFDEQKGTQVSRPDPSEAFLNRYEIDRRSVFIGNLPSGVADLHDRLRDLLGDLGDVVDVQVITRGAREDREPAVFAFVEFARPDMAALAVDRLHGRSLFGCEVRVERKSGRDSTNRQPIRTPLADGIRSNFQSPRYNRSRSRHYGMNSPETPLRNNGYQNQLTDPGIHDMRSTGIFAGPGLDWQSPPANYTTSPYAQTPGSAGYNAATPQMPSPFASQAQAMATPYGYYPATNYSWISPYLADPNLASLALAQAAYGHLPTSGVQATTTTSGDGNQDAPDTPTRDKRRGDDES